MPRETDVSNPTGLNGTGNSALAAQDSDMRQDAENGAQSAVTPAAGASDPNDYLRTGVWTGSTQQRKARRSQAVWACGATVALVSGVWLWSMGEYAVGGAIGGAGVGVLANVPFVQRAARKRLDEQHAVVALAREVQATLDRSHDTPTMRDLLDLNRIEMAGYHQLTKGQAAKSFRNSQIAMYAGFLILCACITAIVFKDMPPEAKLSTAALGAIGTTISGFISRTFLRIHELSIAQLNRFFGQPLVSSYLLTAERVSGQLKGPAREGALIAVVERALGSAVSERQDQGRESSAKPRVSKGVRLPKPRSRSNDEKGAAPVESQAIG